MLFIVSVWIPIILIVKRSGTQPYHLVALTDTEAAQAGLGAFHAGRSNYLPLSATQVYIARHKPERRAAWRGNFAYILSP